jgi:hypothetical protein
MFEESWGNDMPKDLKKNCWQRIWNL